MFLSLATVQGQRGLTSHIRPTQVLLIKPAVQSEQEWNLNAAETRPDPTRLRSTPIRTPPGPVMSYFSRFPPKCPMKFWFPLIQIMIKWRFSNPTVKGKRTKLSFSVFVQRSSLSLIIIIIIKLYLFYLRGWRLKVMVFVFPGGGEEEEAAAARGATVVTAHQSCNIESVVAMTTAAALTISLCTEAQKDQNLSSLVSSCLRVRSNCMFLEYMDVFISRFNRCINIYRRRVVKMSPVIWMNLSDFRAELPTHWVQTFMFDKISWNGGDVCVLVSCLSWIYRHIFSAMRE